MVKLKHMPSAHIIAGLAGIVDFYRIGGVPIARTWPKKWKGTPSRRMTCNQRRFARFQKGLSAWNRPVKKLCKHSNAYTSWRWNDYAYKCYMGRVPYARLYRPPGEYQVYKPCPDPVGRFFLMHSAYLSLKRISNYPPSAGDLAGQPRYLADLIFWVDQPDLRLKMIVDYIPPLMDEHWRTQRGVKKLCGTEPVRFLGSHEYYMDTPYYGESPWFTHGIPLSSHSVPNIFDEFWGYLVMDEEPQYLWEPRNGFSVTPMFHYRWPGYPSMAIGDYRFHHLDPINPIQWQNLKPWGWMTWNAVWRSEQWPSMEWERPDYFYRIEPWYWW